jgi:nitroreductase
MDAIDAIMTRRSVRKYKEKKIPDDIIKQLLEAAMQAPSAANEQPWHFLVITERKILEQVPAFHPHSHMLKEAPLAILICDDPELEIFKNRGILDCSAATENVLLAAHALGLGAVWLGIYPVEERIAGMRRLLNMPSSVIPVSLVSVGYPNEKHGTDYRFKNERVHLNHWRTPAPYK